MSNSIAPALGAGSTALSAAGYAQAGQAALYQGQAQQQEENYSADVLQQQANQTRAQTSQEVANTARSTDLLLSNARAAGAASGGDLTDPSIVTALDRAAGVGKYSQLSQLYSGEERAVGLENQAALNRYMGAQYLTAGQLKQQEEQTQMLASLLQGGSSLFSKFGGGGLQNFLNGGGNSSGGGSSAPSWSSQPFGPNATPVDTSNGLPWADTGALGGFGEAGTSMAGGDAVAFGTDAMGNFAGVF
jgi:hypothetical protein